MHKIRGVDKTVCTCEQKIAYNYCFAWGDSIKDKESLNEAIYRINTDLQRKKNTTMKKYDTALIFQYVKENIKNYSDNLFIATSYEQIGSFFTLNKAA